MRKSSSISAVESGGTSAVQKLLICAFSLLFACALLGLLSAPGQAFADDASDTDAATQAAAVVDDDEAADASADDAEDDSADDEAADEAADVDDESATDAADADADESADVANATDPADDEAGIQGEGESAYEQIEEGAYIIQSELGSVLDVNGGGTSNGTNVQIYSDNVSAAQRFNIKAAGQDASGEWYYTITNVNSGKVLDVDSNKTTNGANVQIYTSNSTEAQKWYIRAALTKNGNTYYNLVGVASGKVLDVAGGVKDNGTNVQIYAANGTAAQNWLLKLCAATVADGAYIVESSINTKFVMDISSGSANDSARAQLYTNNGTLAQAFAFNYDSYSGYYVITNYNSGKVVDVASGSGAQCNKIQQYVANGTKAQWWQVVANADGTYTFRTAINGRAMDVPSAKAKNSNGLQLYDSNNTAAQKFTLVSTDPEFPTGVVVLRNSANTNLAMDVPSGKATDGGSLQVYAPNGTVAQKFMIESDGEGAYYVRTINGGLYLSADSSGAITQRSLDSAYMQSWTIAATDDGHFTLTPVGSKRALGVANVKQSGALSAASSAKGKSWNLISTALISNGLYTIALASNTNLVLDIDGASLKNAANVQMYTSNNTNAQKFYIYNTGNNVYTITNAYSTKRLDVANAKAEAGNNVWQYDANSTNAQKWTIEWVDGNFVIKSKLGDCALSAASEKSGANVQLAAYDTTDTLQQFALQSTSMKALTTSELINVLDTYSKGNSLVVFKAMNSLSTSTLNALNSAIKAIQNAGRSVAFTMIDLTTGVGISYNSDVVYASACSIKAPYTIALNEYVPSSLSAYRSEMFSALDVSNNETYCEYFYDYGRWPLEKYNSIAHVSDFSWTGWTARYTAEDLCRMWVVSANYLLNNTSSNCSWLKDVLSDNSATMTRSAVSGYGVSTVYAKSGWTDWARTEGALVMAGDHPYVTGIMTNGNLSYSGLISDLAAAIYRAHQELIY